MVSILAVSEVDHGFKLLFVASKLLHAALRRKSRLVGSESG
jgi:hypothetical protein